MKKLLKRSLAIFLCLTMVFNYSFSVLADDNVESSQEKTTHAETIENNGVTENIEKSESEEESEEESEDSFEDIEEPEEDIVDEPEEEIFEDIPEEVEDEFEEVEVSSPSEITDEEEDEDNEISPDMLEEPEEDVSEDEEPALLGSVASPSEVEEETETETEIEEEVEEASPSEIEETTDIFIREVLVDKIKITLTADNGVFPENAELFVEKVEDEHTNEVVDEAINKTKNGEENKTTTFKFDIKMFLDGEEIQPDTEKGTVKVAFTFEEKIENSENINAYHLKEDINGDLTAEKLNTEVITDDTNSEKEVTRIEAKTDGFSIYAIELPNNMFGAAGPHPTVNYDGRNWMSHIPDTTELARLTIPGSHDSGTTEIRFNQTNGLRYAIQNAIINGISNEFSGKILAALLGLIEPVIEPFLNILIENIQSKSGTCQDLTIQEQLNAGVRAFDFRFRYDNGNWGIYHGCDNDGSLQSVFTTCICYDGNAKLTLVNCFETIATFLYNHPTEVIFLNVQNEGGEYNKDIEKRLLQLEQYYGICGNYAKREFSQVVLNENPSLKTTVPSGSLATTTLNNWRGKVIDITDALYAQMSAWSETKEEAEKMAGNYIFGRVYSTGVSEMIGVQTNVMVKLYKLNDPHGECGIPFDISWAWKIPVSIKFNIDKTIISPKAQAAYVNPRFLAKLESAEEPSFSAGDLGFGIITMDFQSKNNCYNIVKKSKLLSGGPDFQWTGGAAPAVPGEILLEEDEYYTINIPYPEGYIEYLKSILSESNSSGGGSGSSGGSPRYDSEGNVLGPSEKQNYTYDGTNPPNLAGNINVSSWNSTTGTQQANNITYVQNTDSFIRADNTPVVTDWVGVTTNDIGKVMWYRTDATGKILKNQFIQIGTNIYYLDNNGIMVTGQYTINGKVYNFDTTVGATEGRFLY